MDEKTKITLKGETLHEAFTLLPTQQGDVALVVQHEGHTEAIKLLTEEALHALVEVMDIQRRKAGSTSFIVELVRRDEDTGEPLAEQEGQVNLTLCLIPTAVLKAAKSNLKGLYTMSQLGMAVVKTPEGKN